MHRRHKTPEVFFTLVIWLSTAAGASAQTDPYERYINTSRDFQPVRQDKQALLSAFPAWTYMPWTYQWTLGYSDASGKWAVDHGYNGAFIDHGDIAADGSPTGRLDWINQFHFRFYVDHLANKHYLHLWDGSPPKNELKALHGNGVRAVPLNAALAEQLHGFIRQHIDAVKSSPNRGAYALDDEISWGHFVHPTMWQVTDDPSAYPAWLRDIYGDSPPTRDRWVTYDDIAPHLRNWTIADFDASPLMDQWTFNDAYWANFLGDLVSFSNALDPHTPCGFVGGQNPSPFGGYDYARLMRKVQFIEAYNMGSSQAIIRSFNPHNAIPAVTTHFHRSVDDDLWQTWYYLAHGNRGMIGWVENWFDGKTPKPWHDQVAPTYRQATGKIGPLMSGAEWLHDGVAIYYSHPSIQLGWILDAQAHGKTWVNRNGDDKLGASHMVRRAWENMLRDEGLQYNFLSYVDCIQQGAPREYHVLILPACLCLSDAEARQITAFCQRGGTVIADYLPGMWDQHGKGRADGGALDALFAVHQDPHWSAKDLFGGGPLWCEVDQDANFTWKTYDEFLTRKNNCRKDASGFNRAAREAPVVQVNRVGAGRAVLLNLSPQWYNAYRVAGRAAAERRSIFMKPVLQAGVQPRVRLSGENAFGAEVTYWKQGKRTIVFVVANPETQVSSEGGGNSIGLTAQTTDVTLSFASAISNVRDERADKRLPDGKELTLAWKTNEAIVLSFATSP